MGSFTKLQKRIGNTIYKLKSTIDELREINEELDSMRQYFKDSPREEIDDLKKRLKNIERNYI